MWKDILLFELKYRKARPATYIYFAALLLLGFILTSTEAVSIGGSGGQVVENGTFAIMQLMAFGVLFSLFFISAIMGVSVIRDFEHRTETLFFTTRIKKADYLTGRFLGSFVVVFLVLLGFPLGLMLGAAMPWKEAHRLGDFQLMNYLTPFVLLMLTNAFILSAIFFSVGALSRKMVVVFMQGLLLFIVYFSVTSLLDNNLSNKTLKSLLDPLGIGAMINQTEYWSIEQKNSSPLSLSGDFLLNRLLWLGIAVAVLAVCYRVFSFTTVLNPVIKEKKLVDVPQKEDFRVRPVPFGRQDFAAYGTKIGAFVKIYFREITRSLPFIVLTLTGIILYFVTFFLLKSAYETEVYPTTYLVLEQLQLFTGFFASLIVIVFTGDLVWKERELKMDLIQDATPLPSWVMLVSKLLALVAAVVVLYLIAIVIGVLSQLLTGFTDINLSLYLQTYFGEKLIGMLVLIFFTFFIQIVVNNKFLGLGLSLLLLLSPALLNLLKVVSNLVRFNSANLMPYSDMNGFGHSVPGFGVLSGYWLAFGALLFVLATLWSVRGTEEGLKVRFKNGKQRMTRPILTLLVAAGVVTLLSGFGFYYSTNVWNELKSEKAEIKERVNYEKTLKKFEHLPQPKIVDVSINVDLFPETRTMNAAGYYWLKNNTDNPIKDLHIMVRENKIFRSDLLQLSKTAKVDSSFARDFSYYIFRLDEPLAAGDSVKLNFKQHFGVKGFEQGRGNTNIVANGTFFNNQFFPQIGYQAAYELSDANERKENGLPEKERLPRREDALAQQENALGKSADRYNFEALVSTSPDQIAIAPGYLQKEWTKDGRRYFHYKMNQPIKNMYSIVSARYAVKKEKYKGVNLEVYYDPKHPYNVDRMIAAMKSSLDYYQREFGPFQYQQLRIMEFPRYQSFAQSFANTIPYSESIGFITKVDEKEDMDLPAFVTAHETAHQWWGHQLVGANVQGSTLLSESFAEYSALMVIKQHLAEHQVQKFVSNELREYLRGRSGERKKELPLSLVENQQYIHYNKGSLVLYAIQDLIGEKKLNSVLKSTLQKGAAAFEQPKVTYPTSELFTNELKAVLPDSLQYVVNDWIDKITFYDLRTTSANAKKENGKYVVDLALKAEKNIADSLGKETPQKFSEWIWVGVYGEPKDGRDNLIYYKRHKIHAGDQRIRVSVSEKPTKAGIDPKTLLIDQKPDDNVMEVSL